MSILFSHFFLKHFFLQNNLLERKSFSWQRTDEWNLLPPLCSPIFSSSPSSFPPLLRPHSHLLPLPTPSFLLVPRWSHFLRHLHTSVVLLPLAAAAVGGMTARRATATGGTNTKRARGARRGRRPARTSAPTRRTRRPWSRDERPPSALSFRCPFVLTLHRGGEHEQETTGGGVDFTSFFFFC